MKTETKRQRHDEEFKQQAVERMKGCDNIHELARELGIERKLLYSWKWQFEGRPEKNHANYLGRKPEETAEDRLRAENKELKEALGQKAAELDFFAALADGDGAPAGGGDLFPQQRAGHDSDQ